MKINVTEIVFAAYVVFPQTPNKKVQLYYLYMLYLFIQNR
jgi:hypothetical protein